MNTIRKYRPASRRYKFAYKAKPRLSRGILKKGAAGPSAAGRVQDKTGRRINRLPEWTDPRSYITKGGRHRLFGEDYERLRLAAFNRSFQRNGLPMCECGCGKVAHWTSFPCFYAGELAHNEHGARKSDELSRVKWKRRECHEREHNCDGKPCPKKERVNAV